ncbi:hypothetical protein [Agaribacterium sp. ZY112]|uniref:hypothetical protein n=1 Tax=Agaribacterium sp. ZY112 TaxID=3233574 RepID=UPI00352423B5
MKIEEERLIYEKISAVYEDGFFLSSTPNGGWADFYKIENNQIIHYSRKSAGWSTEIPDQPICALEHLEISEVGNSTITFTLEDMSKCLTIRQENAKHYYGR